MLTNDIVSFEQPGPDSKCIRVFQYAELRVRYTKISVSETLLS